MKKIEKLFLASLFIVALLASTISVPGSKASAASIGFYTENSFNTPLEFKAMSRAQQNNLLKREGLVLVVGGNVYFAKDALGKPDAEIVKVAIPIYTFEQLHGQLTPSGYSEASVSNFYVISID